MTEQSPESETTKAAETQYAAAEFLPYSPAFRDGAWFYGALVGAYRANGRAFPTEWLYPRERRRIRTSGSGITERFLPEVMEVLSPDPDTDRLLQLRQGSLFGFYERGLSRPVAGRWQDRLLGGMETSGTHPIRALRGFSGAVNGHVRWCPTCRREDEANGRISVWLTLHQIPYVHHCLEHGDLLIYRCANCRTVLEPGWQRRLPSDSCSACGGAVFEGDPPDGAPGYDGMLNLIRAMLNGSISVRSDRWLNACRRRLDSSSSRGLAKIETTLRDRWPTLPAESAWRRATTLVASFESAAADTSIYQRLVLTDALLCSGLAAMSDFNAASEVALEDGLPRPGDPRSELVALLARFEIDEAVADQLLAGTAARTICDRSKVSMRRLYQCLNEASPSIRELIRDCRTMMAKVS